MPVVEATDLVVRYGSAIALHRVSLAVGAGEMVALIGPNGAGKSTLVNTLSGFIRPVAGRLRVRGRLAQVPEGRQVFGGLTVEDNLRLGAWRLRERDPSPVYDVLPGLIPLRRRPAGLLSGGEQQMVAIGRALMGRPDVLLVDELSLGLAPLVVADLADHLRDLNAARGLAILLIEQNARLALHLCSRGYVLEAGRVVTEGTASELLADPRVVAAYLGGPTEVTA